MAHLVDTMAYAGELPWHGLGVKVDDGLGDQVGYPDYYCDAIGILAKIVLHNGGEIVGETSSDGHDFNYSAAQLDDGDLFYGLALDEDNQPHLTHERLERWVQNISIYF